MEKRICNEQTGIGYTLKGDYYLPDLALPKQEDKPIGLWGQRHLRYIKQHHKVQYTNLLTSGKLNDISPTLKSRLRIYFSACRIDDRKRGCDRTTQSRQSNGMGCSDE